MAKEDDFGLRRWLNSTLHSRKHPDAHELVLLASGATAPIWRASFEQAKDDRVDDLVSEVLDAALRHADERGGNVRMFLRWIDVDEKVLLVHSWRCGHGETLALDGSQESVTQQLQGLVKYLGTRDDARQDAAMSLMEHVLGSFSAELKLLRQENRELRLERAAAPITQTEAPSAGDGPAKKGSTTDRVVGELLEYGGKKWIDENIKAKALAAENDNAKKEKET